jgi:hypothetical protein
MRVVEIQELMKTNKTEREETRTRCEKKNTIKRGLVHCG